MNKDKIVQRSVEEKWSIIPQKSTAIHKSGLILPFGNIEAFDPFLIMAEDEMRKGAFDHHPHKGMETVTYVIDGQLNHRDNQGGEGFLRQGDVQWMTAGKGILHLEDAPEGGFAHTLQLWVNLPSSNKQVPPRYQDINRADAPVRKEEGVIVTVYSGNSGSVKSPTQNYTPVTYVEITLEKGILFSQDLPADYNGFVYVLKGSGLFGETKTEATAKDILWLTKSADSESEVKIQAQEPLVVLLIAGKPLREPVALRGPFVMNTEEQLNIAFKEFRDGKFGAW